MATYPYMVQAAWNVLHAVFDQWYREPYRWTYETDLQAEIGGRLNQVFSLQGLGTVEGDYKWAAPGFDRKQQWSRVSYGTYISCEYEPGKSSHYHPDLVIWDELGQDGEIPDGQLWPVLWACELKYDSPDDGSSDVEKLCQLIDQKKITYGCSVQVQHSKDPAGVGGEKWSYPDDKHKRGLFLQVCDVTMPASIERE